MKREEKSKDKLIQYLIQSKGANLSRCKIISDTGISKSRLSELLKEFRAEGYQITAPNRSGIIRLEQTSPIFHDITDKDIRQWLIILVLSRNERLTYPEILFSILSITDPNYMYENPMISGAYSDMDILNYWQEHNEAIKNDIKSLHPLPTLRKDIRELCEAGYVEKKRTIYKNEIHVLYSLSEKAPFVLFENDDELFDFINYCDCFKESIYNNLPLKSIFERVQNIYDWENSDARIHAYGKLNHIDQSQLSYLETYLSHPYKTEKLLITYANKSGKYNFIIETGLIFYSIGTNCFYIPVRNIENNMILQLRLDRVQTIVNTSEKNEFYRCPEILNIYDEMFSSSYDENIYHVKVLFEAFGNIIERVSKLSKKRKRSRFYPLEQPIKNIPHSYVYEDDIRGISAFAQYLRGFGSSAIVVEPQLLQDMMIQSNQKLLSRYKGEL